MEKAEGKMKEAYGAPIDRRRGQEGRGPRAAEEGRSRAKERTRRAEAAAKEAEKERDRQKGKGVLLGDVGDTLPKL